MAPLVQAFEAAHPGYKRRIYWETIPPGLLIKQMEAGGTITVGNMTWTAKPDAYFAGLMKVKVRAVSERYGGASREERGRILDEFTAVTGLHRKHAMRLLRGEAPDRRCGPRPGRRMYDVAVRDLGATHETLCWFGTGCVGYPARSLSM